MARPDPLLSLPWVQAIEELLHLSFQVRSPILVGSRPTVRSPGNLSERAANVRAYDATGALAFSEARANRIARWLSHEEDFDRLWTRRVVVPRLRTSALESLVRAARHSSLSAAGRLSTVWSVSSLPL